MSKELSVDINGVNYKLEQEVLNLFLAISEEKDDYRTVLLRIYAKTRCVKTLEWADDVIQKYGNSPIAYPDMGQGGEA